MQAEEAGVVWGWVGHCAAPCRLFLAGVAPWLGGRAGDKVWDALSRSVRGSLLPHLCMAQFITLGEYDTAQSEAAHCLFPAPVLWRSQCPRCR